MEIDIRQKDVQEVTTIRFADQACALYNDPQGDVIVRCVEGFNIKESLNNDYIRINNLAHAKALIEALNKTIELGWVK